MVMLNISKEIATLFTGKCTVYNNVATEDENGITRQRFIAIYEDVPCRLSTKSSSSAINREVSTATQIIKLFLMNDIEIKAGSKIVVTQNGFTREYKYTGIANVYSSHQELVMEVENYS